MNSFTFTSRSAQETKNFAALLASLLKGGEILFFNGPIGAGKTVMVSAIASYLGFKQSPVSASFSLMKKYKNKTATIYHIDLFRLECGEMFNLGFEEMLQDEKAVILAEWPDAARDFFPRSRLEIEVILKEGDNREIILKPLGKTYEELLENLCKKIKK